MASSVLLHLAEQHEAVAAALVGTLGGIVVAAIRATVKWHGQRVIERLVPTLAKDGRAMDVYLGSDQYISAGANESQEDAPWLANLEDGAPALGPLESPDAHEAAQRETT